MGKKSRKAREAEKAQDAAETLLTATVVESEQPAEAIEPAVPELPADVPAEAPAETAESVAAEEPKAKKARAKKEPAERKPRGRGVGARAKELILARPDLSFQQIADLVNAEIEGAKATANSCRWYAMDLRRKKVEVPDRVKPKKPEAPESARTGDSEPESKA
jgi:hypothetical protein